MKYLKKLLAFITIYIILIFMLNSCTEKAPGKMFSLISPNYSGVTFKNLIKETEEFNVMKYYYIYHGGGVSVGDINNDELPDIYFTGNMVGSHLYLNMGDFKFKEIAREAGVFAAGLWNTGTTMADINADGLLDIYVCRSAAPDPDNRKNLLFINNGDLTFTEKGAEYGVDDSGYSTHAAFFDYDCDGDLDLYVLNHSIQEYAGFSRITRRLKNRNNPNYSDKLYRNDNGTFNDVSDEAGLISNVLGFGLGIAVSDINNDRWPDIYVSNDYNEQDYLYINNQNGTFSESLEKYIGHVPLFSMGSDIADINNDGFTDIMALDMLPEANYRQKMVMGPDNYEKYKMLVNSGFYNQTMRNMLQLNNQGHSFSEIGQFSGVSNTDWSWSALFSDYDNDGYKDLYITNGYKTDFTNMDFINYVVQEKIKDDKTGKQSSMMKLLDKIPSIVEENYMYHNNGNLTFSKITSDWGMNQKSLSNGAAYADFDNDGDMDLVVNNIEEEAFLYRNNAELISGNNYLKLKFRGNAKNTFGVGVKVNLLVDDMMMTQELIPSRGYQSSVGYCMIFGLGKYQTINQLEVTWPDAKVQILKNLDVNQTLVLNQEDAEIDKIDGFRKTSPIFTDITADSIITYRHKENNFEDFNRERLLPHRLSTQGPNIAKADINGDGLDDIFIGGAKERGGQLLLQDNDGRFLPSGNAVFEADKNSEDTGVLFFDADGDNDMDLYVVSGGNEYEEDSHDLQDRLYINSGKGEFMKSTVSLPAMLTSGSCVEASDFDSDGDLDLFIGGRLLPGKYPTSPRSYILENDGNGIFKDVTRKINPVLKSPGMVTDAVWTDFNNDTKDDLIVVGEFMKIRFFVNSNGKLDEITENAGIVNSSGWWNKISAADYDNDGDVDYVVGNFGLNSQLKASLDNPVQLYTADFDKNGSLDPILCSYVMGESYPVFSKDDLLDQLSKLKSKYVYYHDYADQKITDIFSSEELEEASLLEAVNFKTSYIENKGGNKFKIHSLPSEAQFSPVYGIEVMDFNKDGNKDIIISGNLFGTRVKYGRYDALYGLCLSGDGNGNFMPIKPTESGIDFRDEGRDIVSLQTKDKTRLIIFINNNNLPKVYKMNL